MKNITTHNGAYGYNSDRTKPSVRKMILPRTNKLGLTKVMIEVLWYKNSDNSSTFRRISTDVWIYPKSWNKKKQEVQNDPDVELKNTKIDKVYAAVKTYINSKGLQTGNEVYYEGLNLNSLRDLFPSNQVNRKSLCDYIEDYRLFRKGQNTPYGTYKEFKTMQNRILSFDTYRGQKTYFENIDIRWSDEFEHFLRNIAENKGKKGYKDGTIEKTYTILITVLNHFYDRRKSYFINNLSDDFRMTGRNGFKRGTKSVNEANPLNKEQLDALRNHVFDEKHIESIKDRFLWQCFTGLRYGDAFSITADNIKNDWLHLIPDKTKRYRVKVDQPLNSMAISLLQRYDYDMSKLSITNQAYNRELKDMFGIMQIKYPALNFKDDYGSHCARDTFISTCVQNGVDGKTILLWVGQSSYAIMHRYIKVTDEYQQNQMKKAFGKVPSKKNNLKND